MSVAYTWAKPARTRSRSSYLLGESDHPPVRVWAEVAPPGLLAVPLYGGGDPLSRAAQRSKEQADPTGIPEPTSCPRRCKSSVPNERKHVHEHIGVHED